MKRYDRGINAVIDMAETANGKYVRYSDVVEQQVQIDRLVKTMRECAAELQCGVYRECRCDITRSWRGGHEAHCQQAVSEALIKAAEAKKKT